MYRRAERPRVAVALTVLAVVFVVALAAGGVVVGQASVDPGASRAKLHEATASEAAAKRQIAAVNADRDRRLRELEEQRQSALTRARQWRTRAHRAEQRLRTKAAAKRRAAAAAKRRTAKRPSSSAAKATPRPSSPPPPPPPAAVVRPNPAPPPPAPPPGPSCNFPPC